MKRSEQKERERIPSQNGKAEGRLGGKKHYYQINRRLVVGPNRTQDNWWSSGSVKNRDTGEALDPREKLRGVNTREKPRGEVNTQGKRGEGA